MPASTSNALESRHSATPASAATRPARSGLRIHRYGPAITNSGAGPRRGRPRPARSVTLRTASAAPANASNSPTVRTNAGSGGVVAPALHGDLALEVEDLDPLDLVVLLGELVAAQRRAQHAEVGPPREVCDAADLRAGEHRVACEDRRRVPAGGVADVAQRVVAQIGGRDAEAEVERDAAEDDQLTADEAIGILRDHPLVAVHLRGVVQDAGEHDVVGRDDTAARVLDDVAGSEVLEIRVVVGEVGEVAVATRRVVRRERERRLDARGRRLALVQRGVPIALPHLHLALEGQHHLAALVA